MSGGGRVGPILENFGRLASIEYRLVWFEYRFRVVPKEFDRVSSKIDYLVRVIFEEFLSCFEGLKKQAPQPLSGSRVVWAPLFHCICPRKMNNKINFGTLNHF